MSTSSVDGQTSKGLWSHLVPYIAATPSIAAAYKGLSDKSALQLGLPKQNLGIVKTVVQSVKMSPKLGVIVGTQIKVQDFFEKKFKDPDKPASFVDSLKSTLATAACSVPVLTIFNGYTLNPPKTALESLYGLVKRPGIAAAIITRETSFLGSVKVSDPLGRQMEDTFGQNKVVKYSSAFFAGALGSLVGHPADTLLTLWQEGKKYTSFPGLYRGCGTRAKAAGVFTMLYSAMKDNIS